jgi:hypothetical protein
LLTAALRLAVAWQRVLALYCVDLIMQPAFHFNLDPHNF